MGVTYVEGLVRGPSGTRASVPFLVDSGATYTLLPHDVWRAVGPTPKRTATFTLAGTRVERAISECHLPLPRGEAHTPVILGEPGDEPMLGVVTLEIPRAGPEPVHAHASAHADAARIAHVEERAGAYVVAPGFPSTCSTRSGSWGSRR